VVLVCHPELVEESLDAVKGRALRQDICSPLMGRGEHAWASLLADARYARAQADLAADVEPLA
jgi:beta-N-acetylhexosaminidase